MWYIASSWEIRAGAQIIFPFLTLKLPHSNLSVFIIYRPPSSSTYSKPSSVFLDEFSSFLSLAATTPHEFLITGDFNIHLDNASDNLSSKFLTLLSSLWGFHMPPNIREWPYLCRESKMFVEDKTKVACRMSGIE